MYSKINIPVPAWKVYADLPAVVHHAHFLAFHARIAAWAAEDLDFEDAVESAVAGSPPNWVLSDPELSLVATIGQLDADRAEALRAGLESLRTDLASYADRVGDVELSETLTARAAAARDFDPSGYALPVPDDSDVAVASALLGQQVAAVVEPMADAGTDVDVEVIIGTWNRIASKEVHLSGADRQLGVNLGYHDTDVETEVLGRTPQPGSKGGDAAAAQTLLARLYWQRETILAALNRARQRVSRSPSEAATDESAVAGSVDLTGLAPAMQLAYLAPAIEANHRSVIACQAEAVKAAPDQTPDEVARQLAVPTAIASRLKLLAELDADEIRERLLLPHSALGGPWGPGSRPSWHEDPARLYWDAFHPA